MSRSLPDLLEIFRKGIFGSIDPFTYRRPWGTRIEVSVIPDPLHRRRRLELRVRAGDRSLADNRFLLDRELEFCRNRREIADLIADVGRTMAVGMAPRLHEYDPRIGMRFVGSEGWPPCPLFDRPDGRDGRTRRILEAFYTNGVPLPSEYRRCPYCGQQGDPAWAGGNVGWVCAHHLQERGVELHEYRGYARW